MQQCKTSKATRMGGLLVFDGEADRSAAEIPRSGKGLEPATCPPDGRTVLTDWVTSAEPFDVASALLILDGPFAGHCSLPRWEPLLVEELPGTAAFIDLRASLVGPAEAIIEVVSMANIVLACRFASENIDPV